MDASAAVAPSVEAPLNNRDGDFDSKPALTPPTSEDMGRREERMSSELSELESDDDGEEIEPDHYFEGGKIPVFKPTMNQFRSFKKFIDKIDKYGMKSGIVKVIPPKEWRGSLPDLSEAVKTIRVKNPIMQEFAGQHGIYTQANIEKQRSYNLPEWKALTHEAHHQPPARRGERRKPAPAAASRTRTTRAQPAPQHAADDAPAPRRGPGRPRKRPLKTEPKEEQSDDDVDVPPTPKSPGEKEKKPTRSRGKKEADATPTKAKGRQPKSTASRRMNNQAVLADDIDEAAFDDFDYHHEDLDEFSIERCKELEETYWKTINFGQPMYGADMPGSLFDDRTTSWNVAKLENLLDVLGTKVPGVNTAYLYLGMWKATFAWHLEDVDLYSINYIHFGAPKQWYSISQEDARRFEAAMKSIWPRDAKNCAQFLRHKTYLISPAQLEKQFNIKVNRLVHYEGEFVITYPYGYHSGYNLGYNCAESVNFANESWLSYGRIAKKCECESDSVWVDVNEIERKLRGEPTPEYYEETDDEEEEEIEHLPSPPPSVAGKAKRKPGRKPNNKRKRANEEPKEAPKPKKVKRIRIRIKIPGRGMPCILCPNDVDYDELLPTDNGLKAHRICADYTPETYISNEVVCNVANIGKDRLDLKCNYCRSKRGAVFQCSQKKCTRAFHATCAAAAGVQVDLGPMPTFDEEGTEYVYDGYDFRCRFHRPKKRNVKKVTSDTLENDKFIMNYARSLKPKDVVQFQYLDSEMYQVYGGQVIENRIGEGTLLVEVLPDGDRVEVEWKYLLALDPAESERPKPSANAKPLPQHLKENDASLAITNRTDGVPQLGDSFHDPNSTQKWAEFHTAEEVLQKFAKVNLSKPNQLWYYLGKTSTEARPQYTENPTNKTHNPNSIFLDTVKPAPLPIAPIERRPYPASFPMKPGAVAIPRTPIQPRIEPHILPHNQQHHVQQNGRPYQYKPRVETTYRAPVYNYSPDSRKNPNSPVGHQPNVVYDHRATAPQYGHPPYQNSYHSHRPPQAFHHYAPPQASQVSQASQAAFAGPKPPSASGPLLNGISQYAPASSANSATSSNQTLPPYPYYQPPPSNTSRQLPQFPPSQPENQNPRPVYSPHAQHTPQSHGSVRSAAPLANILSKPPPRTSNTPIPDGGFTPDWMPKPANGPTAGASRPPMPPNPNVPTQGLRGPPPSLPPPGRPMPQFQSPDAFQRDMAKAPAFQEGMPKWESMMKQLASSRGPAAPNNPALDPRLDSRIDPMLDPRLAAPLLPGGMPKSYVPPLPPPNDMRHMPSPKRPEYSPISDDGNGRTTPLQPSQIHAGETWRYTPTENRNH